MGREVFGDLVNYEEVDHVVKEEELTEERIAQKLFQDKQIFSEFDQDRLCFWSYQKLLH